jgi:hypothetical protein
VKGWERTLGFDRSNPAKFRKPSKAEPVRVNAKLTRNWIVSLLSFPNMKIVIRADKTNIHAKEQMKTAKSAFELSSEPKAGIQLLKEEVIVVRADCVKIW